MKNLYQQNLKEVVRLFIPIGISVLVIGGFSFILDEKIEWQKKTLQVINNIEAMFITGGIINWVLEDKDRQKQKRYQAWQVLGIIKQVGVKELGTEAQKQCLQDINEDGVSLAGLIAPEAELNYINLNLAKLPHANLTKAQLKYAQLRDANLTGAILENANLEGANLENAILNGTNLRNAILKNANLQGVTLENADLKDADLRNAKNITDEQLRQAKNYKDAKRER